MRLILENRSFMSFIVGACVGIALFAAYPFPSSDPMLQMILTQRPAIFYGVQWTYLIMLFSTPYAALSVLILWMKLRASTAMGSGRSSLSGSLATVRCLIPPKLSSRIPRVGISWRNWIRCCT